MRLSADTYRRVALFSDKTASVRRLGELQKDADGREAGVVTAEMDDARRPLSEHQADYIATLKLQKLDTDHLRISEWMLARLVEWGVPDMKTMAKDLKQAGVEMTDQKGRRGDYHALRHTFSENLDRTGCSRMTKQALLRHGTTGVTAGYSTARIEELFAAIERLHAPGYIPPADAKAAAEAAQAALKTGTDDSARRPPGGPKVGLSLAGTGDQVTSEAPLKMGVGTPCDGAQAAYDAPVVLNSLELAKTGGQNCYNIFINKDLRPSTQVD